MLTALGYTYEVNGHNLRRVGEPAQPSYLRALVSEAMVVWQVTHDGEEFPTSHDMGEIVRQHWNAYLRRAHAAWHVHVVERYEGACSNREIIDLVQRVAQRTGAPLTTLYSTKGVPIPH